MQKIFDAGAHASLEIFNLLVLHVAQGLSSAVVEPAGVAGIRLDHTNAPTGKFGALLVGVGNVINEPCGNL